MRYFGRTDVPLSELGQAMARAAAPPLSSYPIADLVTSSLSRSIECGRLALGDREVRHHVLTELDEIDFGEWEGLTVEEIEARDPERFQAWQATRGDFQFPGGESRRSFFQRIQVAETKLREIDFGECVLFALHRGVIRNLTRLLLADGSDHDLVLGAMSELRRGESGWEAVSVNRREYLAGL